MPVPAAPLPPGLGEAFSHAEALRAGASPGRLRAKDLDTPFRGTRLRTRTAAQPDSATPARSEDPYAQDRAQRDRVMRHVRAFATIMGPDTFYAGRTAAVVLGAPVDHGRDLEVAVSAPRRAPRRRGIRGIKVMPAFASVRVHDGVRITSPASTWAMLGAELTVRELVILGDYLVRTPRDGRGVPRPEQQLATIAQLRSAIAAGARAGVGRLRAAVELIRVGSFSPLETDYRLSAGEAGLPEPELDVVIRGADRRLLGISDAVYRAQRTIVEVEGDHHRTSRGQWDRDIEKYAAYAAEGWEVVRLTGRTVRDDPARGVAIVREVLLRRGWSAG